MAASIGAIGLAGSRSARTLRPGAQVQAQCAVVASNGAHARVAASGSRYAVQRSPARTQVMYIRGIHWLSGRRQLFDGSPAMNDTAMATPPTQSRCHHHRRPGLALRAQGAGRVRDEGRALPGRPDRAVLRQRHIQRALPLAAHPGLHRRPGLHLRQHGDLRVSGGALSRSLPAAGRAAERARARWIEEFADTRMGDVFIWRIFYEAVINPFIWQRPRDKEKIARVVAEELPEVMDIWRSWHRRRLSGRRCIAWPIFPSPCSSAI